jgi:hypothetical protein
MNAPLDTHALVWWVDGSNKLAREQRRATERAAAQGTLFLSETRRVLGAKLVTSDSRIIDSKLVPTI